MAKEKSPYEGTMDRLNGHNALGRIVDVDVPNRRCRVKTIGKIGMTDDHDLVDVQWITTSLSALAGGNEDTSIPQIGQKGVITYINSEPYILGYFRSADPAEADVDPNYVPDPEDALITQGDRILRTVAGNRVILRSGGSVEIESTKLCRTLWLPSNLMYTNTGDMELEADGGSVYWERDKKTNDIVKDSLSWDNLEPTNAVRTQEGASDSGAIYRKTAGPLDENQEVSVPTYDLQIDPTGKVLNTVALTEYKQVGPTGAAYATTQDVGTSQASFSTPSGHIVVFDDSTADGSISVIHKTGASFQITGKGAINLQTVDGNTVSLDSGVITATSAQGAVISASDGVTVSDKSGGQILQITGSGMTLTSGKPITVQAPSVSVNASNVALGNSTAELLSLIFQIVTAIGTATPPATAPFAPISPIATAPEWVAGVLPLLIQLKLLTGTV